MDPVTGAVIGGTALLGGLSANSDRKAAAKAQKAQIEQNRIGREFTKDQLALSLGAMEQAYPLANQARNTGYNLATDMADQGYRGATDMTNAGMQQYSNAIMGLPVDYSQLQAPQFNYADLTTAFGQEAQAPTQAANPGQRDARVIPGQTTNAQLLTMFAGDEDQDWLNSWMSGPSGQNTDWSSFNNADEAIASLSTDPKQLTPGNYKKISNMYRNMFAGKGSQDGTWAGLGRALVAQ